MKHYPNANGIKPWYQDTRALCGSMPSTWYYTKDKDKVTCLQCRWLLNTEERLQKLEQRVPV